MRFEWDEEKEKINIAKHGIDFETAALVFGDPNRIEKYDVAHSIDEDRFITVGMIKTALIMVMVVYTERTNVFRIISARYANRKEIGDYYDGSKKY